MVWEWRLGGWRGGRDRESRGGWGDAFSGDKIEVSAGCAPDLQQTKTSPGSLQRKGKQTKDTNI